MMARLMTGLFGLVALGWDHLKRAVWWSLNTVALVNPWVYFGAAGFVLWLMVALPVVEPIIVQVWLRLIAWF